MEAEFVRRKKLEAKTAAYTIVRADAGTLFTNLGAVAAVTLTLPQDAVKGDFFQFSVMAAQELRVQPGAAGAVYITGAKQADNKYITADDEAESVELVCDGNGDWIARHVTGTWTVEI